MDDKISTNNIRTPQTGVSPIDSNKPPSTSDWKDDGFDLFMRRSIGVIDPEENLLTLIDQKTPAELTQLIGDGGIPGTHITPGTLPSGAVDTTPPAAVTSIDLSNKGISANETGESFAGPHLRASV